MGYTKQALKGISWIFGLRVVIRLISLLRIAILARILSPAQFGLFNIAGLTLILFETLTETGVNIFLIQRSEKFNSYINSAWIVSILRGIFISLLIIALTPIITSFFNAPDASQLLLLISAVPFIKGFINPAVVAFQKELQFNKEFFFRSILFFVEFAITVVIALFTFSPTSIVWGLIGGAIVEVVLSFFIIKPTPVFSFEKTYIGELLHKGKWLTSAGIFSYLFHNIDNIIVGKILGVSQLGYYDMAYKVAMLPITEIADVISKVTLPVYAKINGDKNRLLKAFLKTFASVVFLATPVGIFFFLYPEVIIGLVLGNTWLPAAPVLKVLALYAIVRVIVGTPSPLFLGMGKEKYVTIITAVNFLTLIMLILPLVNLFGLVGVAYAVLFSSVITVLVVLFFLIKIFR